MKARKTYRIKYEQWVPRAPKHRRCIACNPNWWYTVVMLVKRHKYKIDDAMAFTEADFVKAMEIVRGTYERVRTTATE